MRVNRQVVIYRRREGPGYVEGGSFHSIFIKHVSSLQHVKQC